MTIENLNDSNFEEKVLKIQILYYVIFGQNGVVHANKFLLF